MGLSFPMKPFVFAKPIIRIFLLNSDRPNIDNTAEILLR